MALVFEGLGQPWTSPLLPGFGYGFMICGPGQSPFELINFEYATRSYNRGVHELDKVSFVIDCDVEWSSDFPDWLVALSKIV